MDIVQYISVRHIMNLMSLKCRCSQVKVFKNKSKIVSNAWRNVGILSDRTGTGGGYQHVQAADNPTGGGFFCPTSNRSLLLTAV